MRKGILGVELLKWWDRKLGRTGLEVFLETSDAPERELCCCDSSTLTDYERFLSAQSGAGIEVKEKGGRGGSC